MQGSEGLYLLPFVIRGLSLHKKYQLFFSWFRSLINFTTLGAIHRRSNRWLDRKQNERNLGDSGRKEKPGECALGVSPPHSSLYRWAYLGSL